MSRTKTTFARRALASVGAAALGLMGVVGLSATAMAAQGTDGTPPGGAAPDTTGTLNVYKHAGTVTDDPHNGTAQNVTRPPLAGAVFTLCKVDGIDLATAAGWTAAAGKTTANSACAAGTTRTVETGSNGLAKFENLPIGLYLVKETTKPSGVPETSPAADFLVTIPFPSKAGDAANQTSTWLWTVNVYPKNQLTDTSEKTVADPNAHGLGALVPWTITTRPLGSFDNGAPVVSYVIIDKLNGNLKYNSTTSLQYKVPGGDLTTVPTEWYTITPAAPATLAGGDVTVTFSPEGINEINKLQAGTFFQWDLKTEVVGVGKLDNKSFENTGKDEVETGGATTEWGPVKLMKHDAGDKNKGLAGAKFAVYNVNESNDCATLGTKVSVNGVLEFHSDANGIVNIPGLYVGKNGGQTERTYCVVETAAPAGYVLDDTPRPVVVKAEATASVTYEVPNTPTTGPDLPLTGASGTMLMTVGGLGLVAVAGGLYLVTRRKAHQD